MENFNLRAFTTAWCALLIAAPFSSARSTAAPGNPYFTRVVIDARTQNSSHKPKLFDRFSKDGVNDIGSPDSDGFKLYRCSEHWKPYVIFPLPEPGGYEDGVSADINGDGWKDIVLGGWRNRTIWAENPAGQGKDPYTTRWKIHVIDSTRFSHEVCAADVNYDGHCDVVTTSGVYFQGSNPDSWTFVNIGRGGQGTQVGNILGAPDDLLDVVAIYQVHGKNQVAWFENPGHTHRDPVHGHWQVHIIDPLPGGATKNRDQDEMAFALADINDDGRLDVVAANMGEGPDASSDPRQLGDGLVWYEAPRDRRTGTWTRHVIDPTAGWVHASSIQIADFDGDGHLDVCFAEQDQSGVTPGCGSGRHDGVPSPRLAICYNITGDGLRWREQVLSHFPEPGAGGFNSKVGIVEHDRLPSIVTSLHGWCGDANPILLWRNMRR